MAAAGTAVMRARPYQIRVLEQCLAHARAGRHPLAVMPTGTGKTFVALLYSEARRRETGQPILWVAPTDATVRQPAAQLARLGYHVEIEKAEETACLRPLTTQPLAVVASQASLAQSRRLQRYPREGWTLVVDEAHHAPAATWLGVREHFAGPWLGLTATPRRRGVCDLFTPVVAFGRGVTEAVSEGWLVPPRFRHVILPEAVRDALAERDYRALERALPAPVRTLAEALDGRQGLSFWPSVAAAKQAAKWLTSAAGVPAEATHGRQSTADRRAALARYRSGETRVLCSYGVGIEGVDLPGAAVVAIYRQTTPLALAQIIGRVLRPEPGCLDQLHEGSAEERRAAIEASGKCHALVITASSPDATDVALAPPLALWGPLPEAGLIQAQAAATHRDQAVDLDTYERLARLAHADAQERRRAEIEAKAHEAMLRLTVPRQRALEAAAPLEQLTPDQARLVALRRTYRDWRSRGADPRGPRATPAQAAAVARLLVRAAGQGDARRIELEVLGWRRTVAAGAQAYLLRRAGRL